MKSKTNNTELVDSLMKVMGIIKYNGMNIFPEPDGYYVNGKRYLTIDAAKARIDAIDSYIGRSIERANQYTSKKK